MALGKTVSYTPFNETSFGYGSNEIATAHPTEFPNSDSIVKVTIEHGSGNWDTTGHLATPSIGTAVATYHKIQEYWTVKGERDDVDAVLAAMSFFPADKPETRTWTPTALKDNQTSGNYGPTEEPPTIGDTSFSLRVYDGATEVSTQTVTFSVTEAVFGNQRPYWSVAPTAEDVNTAPHDVVAGGLLDLGTISHGSDTENVQVKCEFRHYGYSDYTTGAYGTFTLDNSIYIGDKKPATSNFAKERFDFTGSVAEAQAYLDSVRYYNQENSRTFDMFLTISDGVVGSTLTKTCYFSNNVVTVSTIPDVHYVEDANPAYWDFGLLDFVYDNMPEVDTFTATITLDATGIANTANFDTYITVNTNSYNPTTGVLTISDDQFLVLQAALRNLRYTPIADANSAFTFTVDFTFSNPTLGTSYSATQQTVNVTAQEKSEVTNLTTTHNWTEDKWYDFPITNIPQISHGYNHTFDIIFTLSDADVGRLGRHGNSGFFTNAYGTSAQYKLQGTRDEVNIALQNLYFAPVADYDDDFTISFTVDRTSGDLTYETQSTGSFIMNAIAVDEIGFPLDRPHITWRNNVSTDFVSGLQILDTADTLVGSDLFETTYTVRMMLRQLNTDGATGFAFDQGVLKIKDEYVDLLDTVVDNRTNSVTITGNRSIVNYVLKNLTFVPDPLYAERNRHYVIYQVTRDADGLVLQNYSASVLTWIDNAIIDETGYSVDAQLFDWVEDTPLEFDTKFSITEELTENADYTPANGYDSWYNSQYKVTIRGKYWDGSNAQELADINFTTTTEPNANLLVSGSGTVSDPLILQGSKAELNKAFATMKMTPTTPDFISAPSSGGGFWFEHKLERLFDSSSIINYNEQLGRFNAATDTSEYKTTWTNVKYTEDIQNQSIFAHLDDFIQDGAGDLFDATYDVTIELANELTGKFVPYVEEGYLEDGVSIFVSDYAVRLVGSKAEVNASIKDIIFTPFADVSDNVDIIYTQKRTVNNTLVTHADAVTVATMTGIDTPEFVYGTANNNIQYFVADEFRNGVDTTQTRDDIVAGLADTVLTPKQISTNLGLNYDAPITVTDTFEDTGPSLYKITFDGGTLFTPFNASLNITDTGWQTKEALNTILENGIYPINVIESHPVPVDENEVQSNTFSVTSEQLTKTHDTQYTANFELHRRSASGVDAVIKSGSLTYQFKTGLQLWSYEVEINLTTEATSIASRRLDKNSLYGVKKLNVPFGQVTKETSGYYIDTSPVYWDPVSDNLEVTDGIGSNRAGNTEQYFDVYSALYIDGAPLAQSEQSIYEVGNRFIVEQAIKRPVGGQDYSSSTGRWLLPIQIERSHLQFETSFELKVWTDWGVQLKQGSPSDALILRSIYGPAGDSYGGNISR